MSETNEPDAQHPGRADRRRRQQVIGVVVGVVAVAVVIVIGLTRGGNEDTAGTLGSGGSSKRTTTVAPIPTSTEMPARLVGLSLDAATAEATTAGWTVRVVSKDGEDYMVTLDYVEQRANVTLVGGIVTKATEG